MPKGVEHSPSTGQSTLSFRCFHHRCRKALSPPACGSRTRRCSCVFSSQMPKGVEHDNISGELSRLVVFSSQMPKGVEHVTTPAPFWLTNVCFHHRCRKALSTRSDRRGDRAKRMCFHHRGRKALSTCGRRKS